MTTPETFPSIAAALAACAAGGVEEVQILAESASGVDAVRGIVNAVKYRTQFGGNRALIVHPGALSKAARNALDKVLEAPPDHVRIMLVTP
jgi:DNA polymerase III gamma/tau subunit